MSCFVARRSCRLGMNFDGLLSSLRTFSEARCWLSCACLSLIVTLVKMSLSLPVLPSDARGSVQPCSTLVVLSKFKCPPCCILDTSTTRLSQEHFSQ